jgi:hypothetical protein
MSTEPVTNNHAPDKGLPPVRPPSGRFVMQMFTVPGLIVLVVILIIWGVSWLVSGSTSREKFLEGLRSSNPDIRWRTAHELAQVLLRDRKEPEPKLAVDPGFALDLTELLRTSLANETDIQERLKKLSKDEKDNDKAIAKAKQELDDERKLIDFLCQCLANFNIPIGAPLLCEIAEANDGGDRELALRRQKAVWSLANLGENIKQFKKLSPAQHDWVMGELAREGQGTTKRAEWARATREFLDGKASLKVDETLAKCARSEDQELRQKVALALNFWDGPGVEPTLLMLANDSGHGVRVNEGDEGKKR